MLSRILDDYRRAELNLLSQKEKRISPYIMKLLYTKWGVLTPFEKLINELSINNIISCYKNAYIIRTFDKPLALEMLEDYLTVLDYKANNYFSIHDASITGTLDRIIRTPFNELIKNKSIMKFFKSRGLLGENLELRELDNDASCTILARIPKLIKNCGKLKNKITEYVNKREALVFAVNYVKAKTELDFKILKNRLLIFRDRNSELIKYLQEYNILTCDYGFRVYTDMLLMTVLKHAESTLNI